MNNKTTKQPEEPTEKNHAKEGYVIIICVGALCMVIGAAIIYPEEVKMEDIISTIIKMLRFL